MKHLKQSPMCRHVDLLDYCDNHLDPDEIKWPGVEGYQPTIYFLVKENKIVYIGETVRPLARFKQHRAKGTNHKDFDRVYFKNLPIYLSGDNLRYLESRCLTYLNEMTMYNKKFILQGDRDENPLNHSFLDLYLLRLKADYYERMYYDEQKRLRDERSFIRDILDIRRDLIKHLQ